MELSESLLQQAEIAVDLEMDSLHHYQEKVCLIQVSTRQSSWLIDPLECRDMQPLAAPLADSKVRVVMHGSDYDIRSLHRDFSIVVTNLFDTMIASRFLGIAEFGLAALLKDRFGIELDKKFQKADWSKRPLTREMREYAVADTSNLLPLYDRLNAELQQQNRQLWLEEECRLVSQARVSEKGGPLFLYCKSAGKRKGRTLAILEELLQLRESQARLLDRPPFKVLSADMLLEIAENRPQTISELSTIKGMTPGQINRYSTGLLAAVRRGQELPEDELPRYPHTRRQEPVEGAKELLRKLKVWRETKCTSLGIEPGVLAPNWLLEVLADTLPTTCANLNDIPGMREWQKKLFGQELLAMAAAG